MDYRIKYLSCIFKRKEISINYMHRQLSPQNEKKKKKNASTKTCSPIFIATFSTITKTSNNPNIHQHKNR